MFRPLLTLLLGLMLALGHAPAWLHVSHCGRCVDRQSANELTTGSVENGEHRVDARSALVVQGCGHACCGEAEIDAVAESSHSWFSICESGSSDSSEGCHSDGSETSHHDSETCVVCQSLAAPVGFVTPILDLNASLLAETDCATLTDCTGLIFSNFLPPSRGPPQA